MGGSGQKKGDNRSLTDLRSFGEGAPVNPICRPSWNGTKGEGALDRLLYHLPGDANRPIGILQKAVDALHL